MGAYVALKEYNDCEGMILLSELSRRRIRSINKLIRVGRLEVVLVLRVDKEKGNFKKKPRWRKPLKNVLPGYIDLSKRRVSDEDIAKAEEKYNKAKAVYDNSTETEKKIFNFCFRSIFYRFTAFWVTSLI